VKWHSQYVMYQAFQDFRDRLGRFTDHSRKDWSTGDKTKL
jgi:hypothetical protein